jgi:hypothetical protein
MKTYKVLWIDDEWQKQSDFITEAEQEDIIIDAYETAKAGMEAFVNNIDDWDAIILDAKGFDESADEVASLKGLFNAIKTITEQKTRRFVPWFVFSGQPDRFDNEEFKHSIQGKDPYNKNIQEDKERLFNDIKEEADKSLETQIRHEHADVFATNVDKAIMLKLLIASKTKDNRNPAHLNDIRKIMEDIFNECVIKKLIQPTITKFNERSYHLCQLDIPVYIKRNVHSVVEITQTGSHRTQTDTDITNGSAPYLISSTINELLNIVLWWDGYKKANP